MIIGLTGKAGCGKNTAAEGLAGFFPVAFADKLRLVCGITFGLRLDEMTDPALKNKKLKRWPFQTPRQLLQNVGTDLFREGYPGVWVAGLKGTIEMYRKQQGVGRFVVTDVRFPDEAEAVREWGGYVVRIERPSLKSKDKHQSELSVDKIDADATVINDGSPGLLRARLNLAVLELEEYGAR